MYGMNNMQFELCGTGQVAPVRAMNAYIGVHCNSTNS